MIQPTAAQQVQQVLAVEQQLLARKALAQESLAAIDAELVKVRAALEGIQIGQKLAAEAAPEAPEADPEA
ncbi:hypothetical protein JDBV08_00495 [Mycobacterium phage jiawei]|uniref:hypothetical protein n=1 Tax=Brevundimonas diminuta TaxID=293 RepID=UPI001907C191|nr:hypothetical protein [Brevundimonas diminuta]MBK1968421.1 hypothetical protein [Brevundimonas diminuta]WRQ08266.1 hypothetical protein JDBV08_00495 [Mycobacterium phage jiawei]